MYFTPQMLHTIILAILLQTNYRPLLINAVATNTIVYEKLDIKINNNTDTDYVLLNASSGANFKLSKNKTSTIKMNIGERLYLLNEGKKNTYLFTASEKIASNRRIWETFAQGKNPASKEH